MKTEHFIQTFQQLLLTQPRYALKHVMAENCDFADTAVKSKNCYYSFGVFYCEDVYFARYSRKCSSSSDLTLCVGCEWCYECMDCVRCYMCDWCQNCQNCAESQFCQDCIGCRNCFGCFGLYQKEYHFFNQPLSKEEYEEKVAQIDLNNPEHLAFVHQEVEKLKQGRAVIAHHQIMTENCLGNHLTECRNAEYCFDAFALEDCQYNVEANANKDCCDITVCFETENSYQCIQSPLCYDCNFLLHTDRSNESEFCAYSRNLKKCFGCVGMQDKEYHILNKPYSPEEYEAITAQLKQELIAKGYYNLNLYFVSDYEQQRYLSETDPVLTQ